MPIYVNRIVRVADPLPPAPEGVLNLNCLNFFPNNVTNGIPLYEITPYYLKDAKGRIFENMWQSKVYEKVDAQHEVKAGKVIWSHPGETHVLNGELTPAFWAWREKLWSNPYAVRFPNGYHGRHKCLGNMWYEDGEWKLLPYIPARKKIYCKLYAALVVHTKAYHMLKALVDSGTSIQICEMDVRPGLVTEEVLRYEINNTTIPFGHGYVLATCLMGLTHIFDE